MIYLRRLVLACWGAPKVREEKGPSAPTRAWHWVTEARPPHPSSPALLEAEVLSSLGRLTGTKNSTRPGARVKELQARKGMTQHPPTHRLFTSTPVRDWKAQTAPRVLISPFPQQVTGGNAPQHPTELPGAAHSPPHPPQHCSHQMEGSPPGSHSDQRHCLWRARHIGLRKQPNPPSNCF